MSDGWEKPEQPSTNVAEAKVEGDDLLVRYHSGHVYRYVGGASLLGGLLSAPSPGGYANTYLRDRKTVKL